MENRKIALVTGGVKRLGKEISIALAKKGYDIFLNYFQSTEKEVENVVRILEESNVKVYPFRADISDVKQIRNMFKTLNNKFGKLDLLVNNAAIFEKYDFFEIDENVFDKFVNTNLKSVFFCCQEASRIMLTSKNKISKIINIASLGGFLNWTGYIPYCISKTGVVKLTKLLGKRLAPNILVNAIAPGTIKLGNDKNIVENEINKYPMKNFSDSNDIISIVNYLAIENKYITGQTFIVDGGRVL